jgi:hypothetical protein
VYKLHRTREYSITHTAKRKYLFVMNVVTDAVVVMVAQILITGTKTVTGKVTQPEYQALW